MGDIWREFLGDWRWRVHERSLMELAACVQSEHCFRYDPGSACCGFNGMHRGSCSNVNAMGALHCCLRDSHG